MKKVTAESLGVTCKGYPSEEDALIDCFDCRHCEFRYDDYAVCGFQSPSQRVESPIPFICDKFQW